MLNKLRTKLYRFLQGRYGVDQLGNTIFVVSFILYFISWITRSAIVTILSEAGLIYVIFRSLSKNIVKRQIENKKFMEITTPIRRFYKMIRMAMNDKSNKYMLCPKCYQIVRVPKGRGKIDVTCPKCRHKFSAKS